MKFSHLTSRSSGKIGNLIPTGVSLSLPNPILQSLQGLTCLMMIVKSYGSSFQSWPVFIGAFYRPPSSDEAYVEKIRTSLDKIPVLHNIWLLGDFNLPDIDWSVNCFKPSGRHPAQSKALVAILLDHNLQQMVEEPTRGRNILNLFLTNNDSPTIDELSMALDCLASGNAPGKDGIPAEVLKCCKGSIISELHEILCLCWREGLVPQDMRDANIVTLYKNKGGRSDCNNYRGISLLSVVGKVFARVTLKRLQVLAERVYPESQCGFRAKRSTIDMVFSLRQLQEKCREQRQPLFIAFIDLTKDFDFASREGLFKILPKIGCPPRLLSIIRSFH